MDLPRAQDTQHPIPPPDQKIPASANPYEWYETRITNSLSCTVQSSPARLIRLDALSDAEIEDRCRFPGSAEEALSGNFTNIPVSAEPELFNPEKIQEFIELAQTKVGDDIDLGLYLVEQDITCVPPEGSSSVEGITFKNQILHSITAFSYKDQLMCGPFCGSAAKYVLMHCKDKIPQEGLITTAGALLKPLIDSFSSFTVAFPDQQIFNPQSRPTASEVFDLKLSPTFRLLCGDPLRSTVFKAVSPKPSARKHIFYYSGPDEHLLNGRFTGILHSIREARDEVAAPVRANPEYRTALAEREKIARDYIRRLILPFDQ